MQDAESENSTVSKECKLQGSLCKSAQYVSSKF